MFALIFWFEKMKIVLDGAHWKWTLKVALSKLNLPEDLFVLRALTLIHFLYFRVKEQYLLMVEEWRFLVNKRFSKSQSTLGDLIRNCV